MLPSINNRLRDYIRFNKSDKPIAEYVDFLAFYGSYYKESLVCWYRDNDAGMNLHGFHFTRFPNKSKLILKAQKYYKGNIIDIFQVKETVVNRQQVLKVDIYGKGLLIMNREDLRDEFELVLQYFGLIDKLTLTRIDYALDCEKMCRNKSHTLRTKLKTIIKNEYSGEIEYIRYGSKQSSPQFLRFYNKILDLKKNNSLRLYPEYGKYQNLMRYEIQIQSDGITDDEKFVYYNYLRHIASLGLSVNRSRRSHHKHKVIDMEFIKVQKQILQYKKDNNYTQLAKLVMLLEGCSLSDCIKEGKR